MDNDSSIQCVILPQFNSNLLLPRASVVTVLEGKELDIVVDLQEGLIGKVRWSGVAIPLLSFESVCHGEIARFNSESKTVILHSLSDESHPYIALTFQGALKEVELSEEQMETIKKPKDNEFIQSRVRIDNTEADIPDLPMLMSYTGRFN